MKRPEQDLQRSVIRLLSLALPHGFIVHHSPNGIRAVGRQGGIFKSLGTRAGFPDLIILGQDESERPWTGFIELKAGKGALSDAQQAMHDRIAACGHPLAVVRSLDDVQAFVVGHGLPWRVGL